MGSIIVGSARGQSVAGGQAAAGDQAQRGTPDTRGEVSLQDFYVSSKGWYIIRPKSVSTASRMATLMKEACDNPNLGYSQDFRNGVLKYGIASRTPTWCDCSSLVRACIKEATGVDPGSFDTAAEPSTLAKTGLFETIISFVSLEKTPVCTGDVLVTKRKGHTVIVVDSPFSRPDGKAEATYLPEIEMGSTSEDLSYIEGSAGFEPRTTAPKLEPRPDPVYTEVTDKKTGKKTKQVTGYTEDERDLYYVNEDDEVPGYNIFNTLDTQAYVWCRFSEIMDTPCSLGKGHLGSLYSHSEDGYERNVAATLGAVMCFCKPGTPGWAGIVESIDPEGSVTLSCYSASGEFELVTRTKRYGAWDFDGYKFQGFIHNPGVSQVGVAESAKETFLRIAESQVGSGSSWTFQRVDLSDNNGWSAAFITACSARAGSSLNIVIPNVVSCSAIGRVGVLRNMGEWYDGPALGKFATPEPGDIALYRLKANNSKMSRYMCDHAGVVSEISGSTFTSIEGDVGGRVAKKTRNISDRNISGYFRPKWYIIDGTSDSVNQYRDIQGLYTNGVSINDACAREVCYVDKNYLPSIKQSKIKLSAINYTGLLGNMYSVFAQSSLADAGKAELVVDLWTNTIRSYYQTEGEDFVSSSESVMLDIIESGSSGDNQEISADASMQNAEQNEQIAYDHLRSKGISVAGAIGIMANIKAESKFRPSAEGDGGYWDTSGGTKEWKWDYNLQNPKSFPTSFGICQWHNNKSSNFQAGRGQNMKDFVGPNWKNDLTGQLNFLLTELRDTSSYAATWSAISSAPNTLAGAKKVADTFVRNFERPANVDAESISRQGNAAEYWQKLVN